MLNEDNDVDYIIFERKKGIDKNIDTEKLSRKLYKNFEGINSINISVQSPYFLGHGQNIFKKIKAYRNFRKETLKNLTFDDRKNYIGPRTSSLMISLTKYNRIFIDHGYGEYGERASYINKYLKLWYRRVKDQIIILFGLAAAGIGRDGQVVSLCKMNNDWAKHLDYSELIISNYAKEILKNTDINNNRRIVLFLAAGERHSDKGLPQYDGSFDSTNIALIKKNIVPEEFVIIKFHGSLYQENNKPKTNIVRLLNEIGIKSVIFDDIISKDLVGNIPAEILIKYFSIKKIVCECSATVCNISNKKEIEKIVDFSCTENFELRNGQHHQKFEKINKFLENKIKIIK